MVEKWQRYERALDELVKPYLQRSVIIFGQNRSAYCLKRYLKEKYHKDVKAVIDLWERSCEATVLHLYSFFYLYDENDIILNVTDKDVIQEFENCGESWAEVRYRREQIVDVLPLFYGGAGGESIDYYHWLEVNYGIDINGSIRRRDVDGEDAHGYYPTEYRVFSEIFRDRTVGPEDAAFDFGCGKGAMLAMLYQFGFRRLGGVEYTAGVYGQLVRNMQLLSLPYAEGSRVPTRKMIHLYRDDAANMKEKLDSFNWFCMFNPFGMSKTREVIGDILRSMDRVPRQVHILYAEPMGDKLIMDSGRFERQEYPLDFYEGTYWTYVYSSKQE